MMLYRPRGGGGGCSQSTCCLQGRDLILSPLSKGWFGDGSFLVTGPRGLVPLKEGGFTYVGKSL